ncbi:terminase small subunit [Pseudomonas sichuanensis]|uniref:terminase small subunit n=1 Tax=Pseudomonas sichuanensis TaxID=2213015 RepID=UPI0038055AAF
MMHLTKSEFAARRGWAKSYVSKLDSQGRLVMTDDGKVDVEATEALLAETADPSKAAVAARHEAKRTERDASSEPQLADDTPSVGQLPSLSGAERSFQRSKAHREYFLAQQEEANFYKMQGSLVERQAVEDAAFAAGRTLRDLVLGLAPQLAAELTGMSDSWEIEKHLAGAFRRVFDDAAKMSGADLKQAMTQS